MVLATYHLKNLGGFSDGSHSKRTGSESQDTKMIIKLFSEFDNTSFRLIAGFIA